MIEQYKEHPPPPKWSSQSLIFNAMEWNINVAWVAYNVTEINLTASCFVKFIISPNHSFNSVIWRKSCKFWFVHFHSKTVSTVSKKIWGKNTLNYYQSIWNSYCYFVACVHLRLSWNIFGVTFEKPRNPKALIGMCRRKHGVTHRACAVYCTMH